MATQFSLRVSLIAFSVITLLGPVSHASPMYSLKAIPMPEGYSATDPRGGAINNRGEVALSGARIRGEFQWDDLIGAIIYDSAIGVSRFIGYPPGLHESNARAEPLAINEAGVVVGLRSVSWGGRPFARGLIYEKGEWTALPLLESWIYDINDAGEMLAQGRVDPEYYFYYEWWMAPHTGLPCFLCY